MSQLVIQKMKEIVNEPGYGGGKRFIKNCASKKDKLEEYEITITVTEKREVGKEVVSVLATKSSYYCGRYSSKPQSLDAQIRAATDQVRAKYKSSNNLEFSSTYKRKS